MRGIDVDMCENRLTPGLGLLNRGWGRCREKKCLDMTDGEALMRGRIRFTHFPPPIAPPGDSPDAS